MSLAWAPILAFLLAASSAARPTAATAKERSEADARKLADRVLERAIIIDTHADTPQMMLDEGYDLADRSSPYMVSIPKMRDGHLGAEFFSIWVSVDWPAQDCVQRALDLIDRANERVACPS